MREFAIDDLNETIKKYGWLITGVPGGALYTVGLTDMWKHPELAIHGMEAMKAQGILRSAVLRVADGHSFVEPNALHEKVVKGMMVKSLPVNGNNFPDWFGQALDYYEAELRMVQILWPDKAGHFPGDAAYNYAKCGAQKRFDVRRPEYDHITHEHVPGASCAACGKEF